MRIDNVSNNTFGGKLWVSSFVKPSETKFLNGILDYEINGISNRELLKNKRFHLDIWSHNSRQTVHPKIKASAVINYIITRGYCKGQKSQGYNPLEIKLEDGVEKGALALRQHFADTEDIIAEQYPTHYYGKFDRLRQRLRVLFGKV